MTRLLLLASVIGSTAIVAISLNECPTFAHPEIEYSERDLALLLREVFSYALAGPGFG